MHFHCQFTFMLSAVCSVWVLVEQCHLHMHSLWIGWSHLCKRQKEGTPCWTPGAYCKREDRRLLWLSVILKGTLISQSILLNCTPSSSMACLANLCIQLQAGKHWLYTSMVCNSEEKAGVEYWDSSCILGLCRSNWHWKSNIIFVEVLTKRNTSTTSYWYMIIYREYLLRYKKL